MLKTKIVKIGNYDVNIVQFQALEVLNLRAELVSSFKKELDLSGTDHVQIIKAVAGLVYEIKPDLLLKLFKNCSAIDVGELSNVGNFEKVFSENIDGTIELALEVIDINGFFTLNTLSVLAKKIPFLAPFKEALENMIKNLKTKS